MNSLLSLLADASILVFLSMSFTAAMIKSSNFVHDTAKRSKPLAVLYGFFLIPSISFAALATITLTANILK